MWRLQRLCTELKESAKKENISVLTMKIFWMVLGY